MPCPRPSVRRYRHLHGLGVPRSCSAAVLYYNGATTFSHSFIHPHIIAILCSVSAVISSPVYFFSQRLFSPDPAHPPPLPAVYPGPAEEVVSAPRAPGAYPSVERVRLGPDYRAAHSARGRERDMARPPRTRRTRP